MTYTVEIRKYVEVNTDPHRRCYNGCHFSSEIRALPWEAIESGVRQERVEDKLRFWRELNAYAVSQRGESAKAEYRAVEEP